MPRLVRLAACLLAAPAATAQVHAIEDSGGPVPYDAAAYDVKHYRIELAVDPAQQRRGIASALLRELQAIATERGCSALWTVTDTDNEAALATYRSLGARDSSGKTMLEWDGGHATR